VNPLPNGTLIDENFILPKSFYLCMIRYEDGASIARGEEKQLDMVVDVKTFHGHAREEREACVKEEEEVHSDSTPGSTGRHANWPGARPRSAGCHTGSPGRHRPLHQCPPDQDQEILRAHPVPIRRLARPLPARPVPGPVPPDRTPAESKTTWAEPDLGWFVSAIFVPWSSRTPI
jgi:hypothetical protein